VPVLHITSGALAGRDVYYGHAGPGAEINGGKGGVVHAGQQIGEVGAGIVGMSTGPHLEIGFTSAFGKGHSGDGSATQIVEPLLQKTYNAPAPQTASAPATTTTKQHA
jgi:murein DD-endopeptidase MepM/ murein hydrolase activator NlpD